MRTDAPPTARRASKLLLMLHTPGGDPWDLTVSAGMERFIGYYPQLAGLRPPGPLLEYQPLG